jgi:quaternary ammonium compound-resistance protein SugE
VRVRRGVVRPLRRRGPTTAIAYAVGAVFMKSSHGFVRPLPSVMVFACFALRAARQTEAMPCHDIGVGDIIVLGLEAAGAFVLSVGFFGEPTSPTRVASVALVGVGVFLLRRRSEPERAAGYAGGAFARRDAPR